MNDVELGQALRGLRVPPPDGGFEQRLRARLESEGRQIRAARSTRSLPVWREKPAPFAAFALAASLLLAIGAAAAWWRLDRPSPATITAENVPAPPKSAVAHDRPRVEPPKPAAPAPNVVETAVPRVTPPPEAPARWAPRVGPRELGADTAPAVEVPDPPSVAPAAEPTGALGRPRLERLDITATSEANGSAARSERSPAPSRERSGAAVDRSGEPPAARERDLEQARREERRGRPGDTPVRERPEREARDAREAREREARGASEVRETREGRGR